MKTLALTVALAGLITSSCCLSSVVHAATRTWDGGGANSNWTTATNWVGDVAPNPGDDLVFPSGTPQTFNDNDFPSATTFNSINLSGSAYNISGNSIALNAGIVATNGSNQRINNSLILNSNQAFTISLGGNSFFLPGAIDTNGKELTFNAGSSVQVQAVISGAGGLIKTGVGSLSLYASNTFSGPMQVLQGGLNVYHQNALGTTNGNTSVSPDASLALLNTIVTSEAFVFGGSLTSAGAGTKTLNGPILLSTSNAIIYVFPGAPLTVNGSISGSGGFSKVSSDTLTLNGSNTYTGTTTVSGGGLLVNGSQPGSPIVFLGDALGGTGRVGTITVSGSLPKTLTPGVNGPGVLNCSNVTLNSTTTFAVELNGTNPGSGYDQLNVTGNVSLANAVLQVFPGLVLSANYPFVIFNNDGSDSINGTFSGLPEGATVNAGTNQLTISYAGGDGNDIVLTRIAAPTIETRLAIELLFANAVRLLWPTNPAGFNLESNTNLATTNWVGASPPTVIGTNNVVTNTTTGSQKFYRLRKP